MAARRIKGVIEPVARRGPKSERLQTGDKEMDDKKSEEVPPADLALIMDGVDMRLGDAPPNTRYAEYVRRHPSYAYRNYMRFMLIGFALFIFGAATMPEHVTRWYVQLAVVVLLIGNGVICWAFTQDWDSDSRFVGFGGPAVLPAVLASAIVFGFVRFG